MRHITIKCLNLKKLLFQLFVITLVSCNYHTNKRNTSEKTTPISNSTSNDFNKALTDLEQQSMSLNYDSLGELVSKIRFYIKTNKLDNNKDGIIPYIRIDSPQNDLKNLVDIDEIVIRETKATVIIDYPLSVNYKFEIVSLSGFTRAKLINIISSQYYQLYEEEERTASIKTLSMKQRKIYNRNTTNGKFGIWGHDISDLVLDEIDVYKTSKGNIILTLQIES